jgi:hypothetical protein
VSRRFDVVSHIAVGLVLCAVVLHAIERRREFGGSENPLSGAAPEGASAFGIFARSNRGS